MVYAGAYVSAPRLLGQMDRDIYELSRWIRGDTSRVLSLRRCRATRWPRRACSRSLREPTFLVVVCRVRTLNWSPGARLCCRTVAGALFGTKRIRRRQTCVCSIRVCNMRLGCCMTYRVQFAVARTSLALGRVSQLTTCRSQRGSRLLQMRIVNTLRTDATSSVLWGMFPFDWR
jgi:hypothetical protein